MGLLLVKSLVGQETAETACVEVLGFAYPIKVTTPLFTRERTKETD